MHQSLKSVLTGLVLTSIVASSTRLLGGEIPAAALKNFQSGAAGFQSGAAGSNVGLLNLGRAQNPATISTISDVALDQHGVLNGTFVNSSGLPQAGVLIIGRQSKNDPRTTRTDAKGDFKLAGLKSGSLSVTVGSETSWARVWHANVAPPAAKSNLLFVRKASVIRGQSANGGLISAFDSGTLFSVGAGLAGVTLGVIGISEASEANDEADSAQRSAALANDEAASLRDQLNSLSTTVSTQGTQLNALQMQVDDITATLN